MRSFVSGAAALLTLGLLAVPASAEKAEVILIPDSWRIQNNQGNVIVVYTFGTTGSCARLGMDQGWSGEDRERFWTLVANSKTNRKKVFIYYETASCQITSFGLPQE